jgi:hypothetical protein
LEEGSPSANEGRFDNAEDLEAEGVRQVDAIFAWAEAVVARHEQRLQRLYVCMYVQGNHLPFISLMAWLNLGVFVSHPLKPIIAA